MVPFYRTAGKHTEKLDTKEKKQGAKEAGAVRLLWKGNPTVKKPRRYSLQLKPCLCQGIGRHA